jgi:hypothetical protein
LIINDLAFDAALLELNELKDFIEIYEKVFPNAFREIKDKIFYIKY